MKQKIIEATSKAGNYGKFMVMAFDEEDWKLKSKVDGNPFLASRGWGRVHFAVLDLQTGEGAVFQHGGLARADLQKHQIWVCPLFEHFLAWLYTQEIERVTRTLELPDVVDLGDVQFEMYGHRRPGPSEAERKEIEA